MLKTKALGIEFAFSFWFFAFVAMLALLSRVALTFYLVFPIVIHELGHIVAMIALGVKPKTVYFTPVSLNIQRVSGKELSLSREIIISLAGIIFNIIAAVGIYLFSFHSLRNLLMSSSNAAVAIFNLLPIGTLDGGRVVRLICDYFFYPKRALNISKATSFLVLTPLFAAAIFLALSQAANYTLLLTCVYMAVTVVRRN